MGMEGNVNALEDFDGAKAVVLIFTCNRCPVAKAYEDRLIDFTKAYQHGRKQKDVYVVAINVSRHPADSFEKMVARSGEKKYPFAYVHDPSQSVGKAYGVNVSVQAFVLDQERRGHLVDREDR